MTLAKETENSRSESDTYKNNKTRENRRTRNCEYYDLCHQNCLYDIVVSRNTWKTERKATRKSFSITTNGYALSYRQRKVCLFYVSKRKRTAIIVRYRYFR